MKILVCRDIPQLGIDLLKNAGHTVDVRSSDNPFGKDELRLASLDYEAIVSTSKEKLDRKFFEENRHLKLVSQFAAGFDNIDIAAATEFGIPIGHTPQAMNKATSDIAFGLMIAVSRNFFQMHKRIKADTWGDFKPRADLGQELYGKTLGVFGLGAIGFEMARKCKVAYGMKVVYCNRSHNLKAEEELNAQKLDWDDFLAQSDVLSIHSNLSEETKYKFNAFAFSKMKTTAIIINTARGSIIVEDDLIQALKNGKIYGAGLDVSDPEPMDPQNPLLEMPNVCVLPHIGSATVEARDEMSRLAAENLLRYIKDGSMTHCVNREILKK
jgi:glyoxylate reductase